MEITNCEYDAIRLESGENDTCCHHCTIQGNYLHEVALDDNYNAIDLTYIADCRIDGNEIDGSNKGIDYHWGNRNLFVNNMLYNQRTKGMLVGIGEDDEFYFNSIYMDSTSLGFSFAFNSDRGTNRIVKNNVFYDRGPDPTDIAYEVGWELVTYPIISDYNLLYAPNGTLVSCEGYWYTSLPFFQTVTGLDLNSTNEDPLFVSITPGTYDLHLQPQSPAIGQGIPIEGIMYDIDGDLRDPLNPCMGSDEITVAPGLEITLSPIGTPIQIPAGGGTFEFNIEVTNIGAVGIQADVWCDVTLPDTAQYGPVLGPMNILFAAGFIGNRDRAQSVPGGAPSGSYTYNGYVGIYPDSIIDQDSFSFEKLSIGDENLVESWKNTGEPFNEWIFPQSKTIFPEVYSLEQNYPNPFNPITTISFTLPKLSYVELDLYNVTGRKVARLVDGWRDAGVHEVTFDGSSLSSGIYVYRLKAGEFMASGKMVLMK
jgi:hypothetical protein